MIAEDALLEGWSPAPCVYTISAFLECSLLALDVMFMSHSCYAEDDSPTAMKASMVGITITSRQLTVVSFRITDHETRAGEQSSHTDISPPCSFHITSRMCVRGFQFCLPAKGTSPPLLKLSVTALLTAVANSITIFGSHPYQAPSLPKADDSSISSSTCHRYSQ